VQKHDDRAFCALKVVVNADPVRGRERQDKFLRLKIRPDFMALGGSDLGIATALDGIAGLPLK
jgi:hypothetical protein